MRSLFSSVFRLTAMSAVAMLACLSAAAGGEAPAATSAEGRVAPELSPSAMVTSWDQAAADARQEGVEILGITLREAVVTALMNNLDVRIAGFGPRIALAGIDAQLAAFDPVLSAAVSRTSQRPPEVESTVTGPVLEGGIPVIRTTVVPSRSETDLTSYQGALAVRTTTGATLSLSSVNRRTQLTQESFFLGPSVTRQDHYTANVAIALNQPLMRSAGIPFNRSLIRIARNNARMSALDFKNQIMQLLANVDSAYWTLVFANADVRARLKSYQAAEDLLRTTTVRVRAGVLPPIEISRARARLAEREEGIVQARAALRDAEDRLRLLLDSRDYPITSGDRFFPTDVPAIFATDLRLDESIAKAMTLRPDIRQQVVALESYGIVIARAKNQLLPQVDLQATYGLNGIGDDWFGGYGDLATDQRDWSAGLIFSVPIGNRAARSQYVTSRYERLQALAQLAASERNVAYLVKRAIRDVSTSLQSVDTNRLRVQAASEQVEAERQRYEAGQNIITDVLDAQDALQAAESAYVRAIVNFNIAMGAYYRQTGTILSRFGVDVVSPAQVKYGELSEAGLP